MALCFHVLPLAQAHTHTHIRLSNQRFAGDVFNFQIPFGIFPGQTVKIVVPDGRSLPLQVPSNKFQGDTRLTRVSSGSQVGCRKSSPIRSSFCMLFPHMPLTSFDNKLTQFPVSALNSVGRREGCMWFPAKHCDLIQYVDVCCNDLFGDLIEILEQEKIHSAKMCLGFGTRYLISHYPPLSCMAGLQHATAQG